ncbi:MBL fold metallo-hydrolase [Bryobacter aggregatus]|uniref:MBL fold metallo-hydrolase n=1 Tax=Bryobacter aggregatus TaxID=360054 RepID=UPI001EE20D46|nr:MBL fold metallo-hydrolase [Bryobacter aggregatus]
MAISRRLLFSATGAASLAALGYAAYKQAPPFFWRQLYDDMSRVIPEAPHRPTPKDWPDRGLHVAWLGHSTSLVKIDGFHILIDPVFSDRVGVDVFVGTIGPKRLVKPALTIDALPRIDLVLLSHAHFDHWDIPSLKAIAGKEIPVICARQTSDLLNPAKWGEIQELGWRESRSVGPVRVKALEVRHWGARVRRDTYRGYNGYLIEAGRYKVLFGGDTAFTPLFREAAGAKAADLAIMPIGAYNPWIQAHCTPEEAIQMADWANADRILPVHHQTFSLGVEPVREPIERFLNKLGNHTDRVIPYEIGSQWSVIS